MKFKDNILAKAITQTTGFLVALADGEGDGARWNNAVQKAIDETVLNDTIEFDTERGVLTFISRRSNRQRKVTRNGCHASCDCQGRPSYHFALYEIVSRYVAMMPKPKPAAISSFPTIAEMNAAPLLRPTSDKKPEITVGGFRI